MFTLAKIVGKWVIIFSVNLPIKELSMVEFRKLFVSVVLFIKGCLFEHSSSGHVMIYVQVITLTKCYVPIDGV